jgi:enamine deaminase RidA (YjgF/YER057c/UK114 family)
MKYYHENFADLDVSVSYSLFSSADKVAEVHLFYQCGSRFRAFDEQCRNIFEAEGMLLQRPEFGQLKTVFKRVFLSDAANQTGFVESCLHSGTVSIVQQPPLNGSKIAVWAYMVQGVENQQEDECSFAFERNGLTHLWATQLKALGNTVDIQTQTVFEQYKKQLASIGCSIKENCIRTWLYVQNVDVNYGGMVEARKNFFLENGLNEDSHYIASTGIEGRLGDSTVLFVADAYSIKGISQEQVRYLHAHDYLNDTICYGVTFERGTAVDFGDRRHIYISGTASIDSSGNVVHQGDVLLQARRTMTNIEALLADAQANLSDVAQMIVYLRDVADFNCIDDYFATYWREIPKTIVWAPVCRPGWLIEVECIAIKSVSNPRFSAF